MPARPKLPGAHAVTRHLASGQVCIYWYRWRGGPLMMKFGGGSKTEALAAERAGAAELARSYAEKPPRVPVVAARLKDVIAKYRAAPDGFLRLAETTKKQWARWLDIVAIDLGDLPVKTLEAKSIRRDLIEWRNLRQSTPREADNLMTVLKRVLSWGVANGEVDHNPAKGIEGIYRVPPRADQVVSTTELSGVLEKATPRARYVIRFLAATGMRRKDIAELKWEHDHGNRLVFQTSKSRRKKTVTVPIYADGRAVLDELRAERQAAIAAGRVPSAFVFTTAKRRGWKPDSITQAFGRAAGDVDVEKRLNDLRGTAITRYVLADLTNEQIADIVGWEVARVANIRKHYVDANRIAEGLISRLENAAAAGYGVNA